MAEKCPRCSKLVYQAEAQYAANQSWHRGCLRCAIGDCNKPLQVNSLCVEQGDIYCQQCYRTNFADLKGVKRTDSADCRRLDIGDESEVFSLSSVAISAKELLSKDSSELSDEQLQMMELYIREKEVKEIKELAVIDFEKVRKIAGDAETNQVFMDILGKLARILQPTSTVNAMKNMVEKSLSKPRPPPLKPRPSPTAPSPQSTPVLPPLLLPSPSPRSKPAPPPPLQPTPPQPPQLPPRPVLPLPQPTPAPEPSTVPKVPQKPIYHTVEILGLKAYFPERITRKEIIQIKANSHLDKKCDQKNLCWKVLANLIGCNSHGRDIVPEEEPSTSQGMALLSIEDDDEDEDDSLNPMDILFTIYLCTDKEVQQILCRSLFSCKLAFPYIYSLSEGNLMVSNWSLRDIVVQFRDERDHYVETSLISDYQFPVVSFVRIGKLPVSKSRLLNSLINDSAHETFFHSDCTNGHARRICSNGLVEATVFLPSKTSDSSGLTRAFLAANLRGDLLEFPNEAKLIGQVSDVIVVFTDVGGLSEPEYLEKFREINGMEVIIVLFKSKVATLERAQKTEAEEALKRFSCVYAFGTKRNKPEKELLDEIRRRLGESLTRLEKKSLNTTIMTSDESDEVRKARELSALVTRQLEQCDIREIKETHLPLQEKWEVFSGHFKKENSSKAKDEERAYAQKERVKLRQQQIELCSRLSPIMTQFLTTLINIGRDELLVKLWLQWLKLYFDNTSRKQLPMLRKKQNEQRKSLQNSEEDVKTSNEEQQKRFARDVMRASVGLENIFRESGQIFEALHVSTTSDQKRVLNTNEIRSLSQIFAKLLLWGVPLEILDGDAGNIPSSWISAILKSCQELVGDKKIYVISVLGLQSSGKSTLLNTMFGLKFAVSAGRCTRGAFLQLVPVESGAYPFDYIAVIDTEGLRAPELGLDKHHHDNELATLVIGLGDVTIINIKGENTAEMKDILQIAIHAFIRMKIANKNRDLHRHCIFIHQNVPAVGAKELMQEATSKMQQTLDAITKEAAEGEGLKDVKRFGDVLEFNRDSDIFFMSDLWQGDPPMAPVNPGYSADVQKVKQHLLHMLDKEQKSYLGFVDFSNRVSDLWKAILSEDFVFSFRSSIELKAYNILEKKFLEVMTKIEEKSEEWLWKTATIRIRKCRSVSALADAQLETNNQLRALMDEQLQCGLKSLEEFFDENQYSEHTIQWKERRLACLKDAVADQGKDMQRKLLVMFDRQKLELEQGKLKAKWESTILKAAAELALRVRSTQMSEAEVQSQFNRLWDSFLVELPSEQEVSPENIREQVVENLRANYHANINILNEFLKQISFLDFPKDLNEASLRSLIFSKDFVQLVSVKRSKSQKFKAYISGHQGELSSQEMRIVVQVVAEILASVGHLCQDMAKESTGFSKRHVTRVKECVSQGIESAGKLSGNHITTTPAFEIKVLLIALGYAFPTFVKLDTCFYEANSLKSKLDEVRSKMWNLFENIVRKQSEAKIAADFCRDHLGTVMKQAIQERKAGKLKGILLNEIGRTKFQLIVRMLTDMAHRNDFSSISAYVSDSRTSALKWLTQFVNQFLFTKTGDEQSVFSATIESSLIQSMIAVAEAAVKNATLNSRTLNDWIERFCKECEKEIAVLPGNLQHILQYSSVKVEDLQSHLLSGLKELRTQLVQSYAEVNGTNVTWHGSSTLYSDVLESMWGCAEQCPFCSEPCCKSTKNHYEKDGSPHSCIQHRPSGVDGVYWNGRDELVFKTCDHSVTSDDLFSCGFCKRKGKKTAACRQDDSDPIIFHPYKEYKNYFPEWEIEPDTGNTSAKFWSWFSWTFRNELKAKHQKGIAELPAAWELVPKQEAIDSLRSLLD